MILYFSATGNCKYVASRLSKSTAQDMLSIVDCIREARYSFDDDSIGIIAPTYFWGYSSPQAVPLPLKGKDKSAI